MIKHGLLTVLILIFAIRIHCQTTGSPNSNVSSNSPPSSAENSLVVFYGRYACNVEDVDMYCPKDAYTAMAFYYGMIAGGMNADGTFNNSNVRLTFKDPTNVYAKKDLSMSEPYWGSMPAYTDMSMDDLMFGNETVISLVGFEGDCKEVSSLVDAYDTVALMVQCFDSVGESKLPVTNGVQMSTTMGALYRAFAALAKSIGWTNVGIINTFDDGHNDRSDHGQLLDSLAKQGIDIDYVHKGMIPTTAAIYSGAESWMRIIHESYLKTRIYIIISNSPLDVAVFMNSLCTAGLLETGKYVVINIQPVPKDPQLENFLTSFSSLWDKIKNQQNGVPLYISNSMMRNYYRSLFIFTDVASIKDEFNGANGTWEQLLDEIGKKKVKPAVCPPLCDRNEKTVKSHAPFEGEIYDASVSAAMGNGYDAGKLLATVINANQVDLLNATALSEYIKQQSYKSVLGYNSSFDSQGIAMRQYILWNPQVAEAPLGIYEWAGQAAVVLPDGRGDYVNIFFKFVLKYYIFHTVQWNNLTNLGVLRGKMPESKPKCGFNMEFCPTDISALSELEIAAICATLVCTIVLAAVLYYVIKRISYERRLQTMYFLVPRSQIYLRDRGKWKSTVGSVFQTTAALQAMAHDPRENADQYRPKPTLNFYHQNITRAVDATKKRRKEDVTVRDRWAEIIDWELAEYKGKLIALRKLEKESLKLTRPMKEELDKLMKCEHDNINAFYGLVNEGRFIFTIHGFAVRNTLNDILRNTDLRLDKLFKHSFIFDLIKGLQFLHDDSAVGYHGNLKSSNCVVDEYWRVKLSSFGMEQIRIDEPEQRSQDLLWSAPEILRRHCIKWDLDREQLMKADIYSFGIVVYEIFGREGPYGDDDLLDTNEIIEQIKFPRSDIITRPDLSSIKQHTPDLILNTLPLAWHEEPKRRPAVSWIKKIWKGAGIDNKDNLADNIMALFDRYTNNLEGIVKEKTQELEEEKRRNENLLLQMLPPTVAKDLANGKPVEAEYYEAVTIYFSDVVGFTALSSKSTPMQVVAMLNNLYTSFDSIIDHFDCYKVETIGDAYMFVSGLPERNGLCHAGEVSGAALELLETIKSYTVPHVPEERLRLRIGIHSGSVVTGVVGIKMPRYCLFGETVITASQMESSGEPMRVQLSQEAQRILSAIGGYEMQLRTDGKLKNNELKTYWLHAYSREARLARIREEGKKYENLKKLVDRSVKKWNLM